jgi:hypothetical protein
MPLPSVPGWLIDFATAQGIFDSGVAKRLNHCAEMCRSGIFHIAYAEERLFKGHPVLSEHFLKSQNRIVYPTPAISTECVNIANNPKCKKLLPGNQSAIILTAIAASEGYGLISDATSTFYVTAYDLCDHFGFHALTSVRYFKEIL